MLGHFRSQRMAKLQIFTCWSLSAPTQSKSMNMHGKYTSQSLAKKASNKFMIIRYRLQSTYYVNFVENKQSKTYNLIQVIFINQIKYINSTSLKF